MASHLPVLDYKFCDRRLENVNGYLVCSFADGGTPRIFFTPEPCIDVPILELGLGEPGFDYIDSHMGEAGCLRRLAPGPEVEGWLRAIGGKWVISALPSEVTPDPLPVENLIVNDTATILNLVIATDGGLCFDSPTAGTITQNIGLNSEGCLVTGTVSQIEAAMYYESASLVSASTPNSPIARNANAVFGNEIFDPQSIASIVSTTRIKADKAGTFLLMWSAFFDRDPNNDSANGQPSLDLVINSSIVALGCGRAVNVNPPASAVIHGMHLVVLAINDTIDLRVNNTANLTNNLLRDVKLILVKYRGT